MKRKKRRIKLTGTMVCNIISFMVIALLLYKQACMSAGVVQGESMYPTLHPTEKIYTSSLAKQLWGINRGDIVTATVEIEEKKHDIIKRVIAVPYDRVEIKDGVVKVNGQQIEEPYLPKGTVTDGNVNIILLKDEYFLMGDNREVSLDSRDYRVGPVKIDNITSICMKTEK